MAEPVDRLTTNWIVRGLRFEQRAEKCEQTIGQSAKARPWLSIIAAKPVIVLPTFGRVAYWRATSGERILALEITGKAQTPWSVFFPILGFAVLFLPDFFLSR